MGRYTDTPTKTVIRLANNGDKDACMELSLRYSTGTALLEKNPAKAEYWRKQSFIDYSGNTSYSNGEKSYSESNQATMKQDENRMVDIEEYDKKYDWAIIPDKNKHEYVIGIDFGHGETSAAFCPIGWDLASEELETVKDIDFGANRKVLPSAINIQPDGQAFLGDAAFSPERLKKATVEVLFKKKPEDINGEKEQLMIRYMHEVYALIREKNTALFSDNNHLVYIATPSGWDKNAKNLYGQMARKAGLPIAGITSESRAAFIKAQLDVSSGLPQYVSQGAIVFDMGASTLDFTYFRAGESPIDFGYDCGASRVEKIMYAEIRNKNHDIIDFEEKYPKLISKLLYEARCAKEGVYFDPSIRYKRTVNFEDIVDDDEFEDAKMKFVFQPGELNQMLENNGYINEIRQAMLDFKNNHINGNPIRAAFLTGGASRMDFIQMLMEDCWRLPKDLVYRDQDPSLTISRGVAEVARRDIQGGKIEIKEIIELVNSSGNRIYSLFANSLVEKISTEVSDTVGACVTQFKNQNEDVSINDLEVYINDNIENDMNNICEWAEECYQKAFEQETAEIRERLKKTSNYSRQSISMQKGNVSLQTLPNLDMSIIAEQMRTISSDMMDSGFLKDITAGIAGGAIAGAIFMLLGGPLAWILGGAAAFFTNYFFGDNDSEEEKKQKARMKDLNKESRQKVYDHFETHWDEITAQIHSSVQNAICSNHRLQTAVESQSTKIVSDYAQECITQMRLMLE